MSYNGTFALQLLLGLFGVLGIFGLCHAQRTLPKNSILVYSERPPMRRQHKHRRYMSSLERPDRSILRSFLGLLIIALVLFGVGSWVLRRFEAGNTLQRSGVTLSIEQSDTVNVSIEGGEWKRAENGQKLYPGDRVSTGARSHALLSFFDGTLMRLSELSDLTIKEHVLGKSESEITVSSEKGGAWISTPSREAFSGSIARTYRAETMTLTLPSQTEAITMQNAVSVFAADGIGVTVETDGGVIPIIVGEGQKFVLSQDVSPDDDLYAYRSALDPLSVLSPFVEDSRLIALSTPKKAQGTPLTADVTADEDEPLIVTSPIDNVTLDTATVEVSGIVGPTVDRIRANGYAIEIDEESRTFSQELALPDEDAIDIMILALSQEGETLAEIRRHILRDRKQPDPPRIIQPAADGLTYRTQSERLLIEGETSSDTIGIIVNDYRLQLYSPGDRSWKYLAATQMDNLKPGKNVYSVRAINRGGYESETVEITVLLEEGVEGIVEEAEESEDTEESEEVGVVRDTVPLPTNDPLEPGSLTITSPNDGSNYQANSDFLIEGNVSLNTHSVWVNGYQLRLFEPGKDFWNYIADPALNTLKPGRNVYRIVARDKEGMILDTLRYVVQFVTEN